ncbi:hypothetical protein SERLA73DRAFT_149349 [Serpula lacrymans var. lacrymans S7.3]|uniref:Uncharacterized protein n=1 Tax=Serpula lacrymans var. lacrymans (strain S7.3) TaxID=936435 RepID=F8PHZ5_SERL3|nr:hypothetical protein SERLA73DRAFT_149349 [Serpula lacrymans var. lacrymans S7.3]
MASKTLGPGITLRRQKSNHMVIPDSKEKRVSVGGNEQYKEDSDLSPPPPSRFRHRRNLSPPPPSQVQCRSSRAIDIPASEEDIAETHWGDFDNGTQLDMANPGDCSINESGGLGVATRERVSKHTEVDERAREDIEESDEEERPKKKKKMNMREAVSALHKQSDGPVNQKAPCLITDGSAVQSFELDVVEDWANHVASNANSIKSQGKLLATNSRLLSQITDIEKSKKTTSTALTSLSSTANSSNAHANDDNNGSLYHPGGFIDPDEDEADEKMALKGKKRTTTSLGTSENPWNLNDPKVLIAMQLGQQVYKWHNSFSASAQAMLEHLFDTMPDFRSQESCQLFSKSMLEDLTFLYGVVGPERSVEHIFTKQSQVPILCAEDKEEDDVSLEGRNSMSTGKSFLKPIPQLNVLSGKETTVHDNFSSANWGAATRG